MRSLLVVLVLVGIGGISCPGSMANARVIEELWLPASAVPDPDVSRAAQRVHGWSVARSGIMSASLTWTGDREALTNALIRHFGRSSWRQRARLHMNPTFATSFAEGWRNGGGGVLLTLPGGTPPTGPYYKWYGEWENPRGDIVAYYFGGTEPTYGGSALYLPAPIAKDAAARARAVLARIRPRQ